MKDSPKVISTDDAKTGLLQNSFRTLNKKFHLSDGLKDRPLKVLSKQDWQDWIHKGYVIVKQAVPKENVIRLADFLWKFEGKDPANPETWYGIKGPEMKMKELTNTGMVEVYNHQFLWDNRQTKRVYEAFTDVWGTDELWSTIDRANLNFPIRPGFEYKGFIHWDENLETNPQNVQGVLALSDQTDENSGGFQCIPDLYRTYETWKLTQPIDRDLYRPDTAGFEIEKVKLEAGDLLIFNSRLPHGIRPNHSKDTVRIAQYISMFPADDSNSTVRDQRISSWKNRIASTGDAFPGDPLNREQGFPVAILTALGNKLLGLDSWDDKTRI